MPVYTLTYPSLPVVGTAPTDLSPLAWGFAVGAGEVVRRVTIQGVAGARDATVGASTVVLERAGSPVGSPQAIVFAQPIGNVGPSAPASFDLGGAGLTAAQVNGADFGLRFNYLGTGDVSITGLEMTVETSSVLEEPFRYVSKVRVI